MALEQGTRFGSYEIIEQIGSGGMGEVYRARDAELERDVAIKVLPESFVSDTGRIARFEQEAKTLAALNHPNIAHIYGLERSGNSTGLVMELIEGPTLADRISEGPIPADEALGIAMQIAAGLEVAHGQGIVHRDLKPANIKLKADGSIKVLDFGIAKALAPELSTDGQSPLMTTPVTQVGVILGTAAYMSPEQARGKPVDQRADIWAFGCLLYEMLTGQLAFAGEDVAVIMARIITNDTDMSSLPAMVSPAVQQTIRLCLTKDPAKRIADIRDVRLALEGKFESDAATGTTAAAIVQHSPLRRLLGTGAAVAIGMAIAGLIAFTLWPEPEAKAVTRFAIPLASEQNLRNTGRPVIDISRDGRQILFNSVSGIVLRRLNGLDDRIVSGSEDVLAGPFFSADGQSIAYWDTSGSIERIGVTGGATVPVARDLTDNLYGAYWTSDNEIFYGQPDGIYRVAIDSGEPELIVTTEENRSLYGAQLLPDGDSLLFSLSDGSNWDTATVMIQSLSTGERHPLISGGNDAHYVSTGHILYVFEDVLYARAFDLETLTVAGGPEPMIEGLVRATLTGAGNYAVSDDGTLIYLTGELGFGNNNLIWVDRNGNEQPLTPVQDGQHFNPRISPDGTRLAITIATFNDGAQDIWVYDLVRPSAPIRLTFSPVTESRPIWSVDSQRIIYFSSGNGGQLMSRPASGAGTETLLAELGSLNLFPELILPDESGVVLRNQPSDRRGLFSVSLTGEATVEPFIADANIRAGSASLSPDERWLAYASDRTGEYEIYVRPFPDIDTVEFKVSINGGTEPRWSPDGSELFFLSDGGAYVVTVATDASFSPGDPVRLFDTPYTINDASLPNWDIHPDGNRFIFIGNPAQGSEEQRMAIVVVENWFEELKARAPVD
jgi:Tol biopolymer transport system component